MNPYEIYGKIVEYRVSFGRLFVHVNVAPRHKHRYRLDAVESAVRDIFVAPEEGEEKILPFGYTLEIYDPKLKKRVPCDRIRARFRFLQNLPESVIDDMFPHQKGGITPGDVFIDELSFLAVE